MITHSSTITKLMGAMLKVQGAVEGVRKDSKNPHFKSSYASLEAVVETIRPACQEHGLVPMQSPGQCRDGIITVETFICHAESGEWIKGACELPLAKSDPQGAGSAITYAERYSLMAMFNLPPVDDDGEAATRETFRPSRPAPGEQPATGLAAKAIAERLGGAIRGTRNGADLDDLLADPDVKAKFNSLPADLKATVGAVITTVRQSFGKAA